MKVWTKKMTESNIKGPIIYNKVLKRIATGRSPAVRDVAEQIVYSDPKG